MNEMNWHFWTDDPPTPGQAIEATYSLDRAWMLGNACKRGCCFIHDDFGSMVIPNFWRERPNVGVTEAKTEVTL